MRQTIIFLFVIVFAFGCVQKQADIDLSGAERSHIDIEALKKKANEGDTKAQTSLARIYASDGDYTNAEKWYKKAMDAGDLEAEYDFAVSYYCKRRGNLKKGYELLLSLILKSNPNAKTCLALLYFYGDKEFKIKQDYSKAFKWSKEASEDGSSSAQFILAAMYGLGLGVKKDPSMAMKWFRKSAEGGFPAAQFELASLLLGLKNYKEAVKWLSKAAEQGNCNAQLYLGIMYCKGEHVKQNYKEAVKWLSKAAEQGNIVAQGNLGMLYDAGKGVEKNEKKAQELYLSAAKGGDSYDQYHLAMIYYEHKEMDKAESCLLKSSENGFCEAKNCLAYFWAKQNKNLDKATSLIKEALTESPEKGHYIDTYGYILLKQGKYKEALREFQKAASLLKKNADLKDHLGDVYLKLGEKERARKEWKDALDLATKDDANLKQEIEAKLISLGK